MAKDQIESKLTELHRELESLDTVDEELLDLLKTLDSDIHELLDSDNAGEAETGELMERIEALGAEFAARHPHLERFFQELIYTLGRLGI